MNILAAIAIVPTLFLNIWLILIGKFFFGFASGALIVACSIYQNETVPAEKAYWFGFTTNFGVIIGITLCLVFGFALPDLTTDPIKAETDKFWIFILCIPEIIICVCLPIWLCIYRTESLKFNLDHENKQDAITLIKRIYVEDKDTLISMSHEEIYH